MPRWYDKAVESICEAAAKGEISQEEFIEQLKDLNAELREQAEEAAEEARRDVMGDWI